MVKAILQDKIDGTRLMFIGLSRKNIIRLMEGKPIVANLKDWGLGEGECYIAFGETEQAIARDILGQASPRTNQIH